jgi:DNA polymerase I-like protein with 3'-5' exonuclease and polymerase domains
MTEQFPDLSAAKQIAIDIETYDPDIKAKGPGVRTNGKIIGIAVGTDIGRRFYLPIDHPETNNLDTQKVYSYLSDQLSRPNQAKLGANLLYDLDYLTHAGVKIEGPFHDVQIAEPLINENKRFYNLNSLAEEYLGELKQTDEIEEICKQNKWRGKPQEHLWRLPASIVGPYAISDVDLPIRIMELQQKELERQGLLNLFELESKLIPLLLKMRQRGVRVDVNKAEILRDKLISDLQINIKKLTKLAGGEVQVWANDSVAKAFDRNSIPYPFTKQGKPSFRKDWLLSHNSELAQLIASVRETEKLIGTFIEGAILDSIVDGKIHCEFNQLRGDETGTVTGRFSSSNPNLQQVPSRGEKSLLVRELFVPDEGDLSGS